MVYQINNMKKKVIQSSQQMQKDINNSISIYVKNSQQSGNRGKYFNIIKAICGKSTANIIFSEEKLKAFPFRLGIRQECPFSLLSFNTILEVLATRGKEKKKESQLKRRGKPLLFANTTIYRKP